MIVKVCGVTDPSIAEVAIEAGADWLGLVLVEASPRYADDQAARRVVGAAAGRVDLVGVLVSPDAAGCREAVSRYRLAAVQVHGRADPGLVEACGVPVIRAINASTAAQAFTLEWWPDGLIHLEAAPEAGELPGGTGRRLPLEWAAAVARHRRLILAGGLTPDTVGAAIRAVRPSGVDASSGLETAPGVKRPALVERFVRAAREAALEAPAWR